MPAVASESAVANIALGLCGQRQLVGNFRTEQTDEALAVATFFDAARDETLSAVDWLQARQRVVLALTTETRDGWGYCYAAPANMLLPRRIWNGLLEYGAGEQVPFTWELNDAGSGFLILTNRADAQLFHTSRQEAVGLWRPHFVRALAMRLAADIAAMLPVKPELAERLAQRSEMELQRAAAQDYNAQTRGEPSDAEWIRER